MREVAKRTAIRPDRLMLVDERTCCLCVTFYADRIARDAAMQSLVLEGAMWVVTIAAIYQPFIHLVVKGLRKGRLYISVAGITKLRLRNLKKAGLAFRFVNAVATRATYACIAVCGSLEIGMRCGVAFQALVIGGLRRHFAEPEDLFYITASLHMLSARPVTAFACHPFASVQQCEPGVRILREFLSNVFMAGLAGFWANEISWVGYVGFLMRAGLLLICACSAHTHSFPDAAQRYDERHTEEHSSHLSLQKGGLATSQPACSGVLGDHLRILRKE